MINIFIKHDYIPFAIQYKHDKKGRPFLQCAAFYNG